MSHEILKPINDIVFKRLMSDKHLLVSFLQSALDLPPEDYADVQIVDPHLLGERPEDKLGILDVKVRTGQGNIVDIETESGARNARAGDFLSFQHDSGAGETGRRLPQDQARYLHPDYGCN